MICENCGIGFNEEDSNAKDTVYCDSICETEKGDSK